MSFAADTALVPAGEGRWRATVHERWWVAAGPFGGFVTALLARALAEVSAHPPRTLAVHFLAAPKAGEVEVAATVERRGRSTDAVSLRLEQDGAVMALALANAGDRRPDSPAWSDLPRPDAAEPEACSEMTRVDPMPAFLAELEVRWIDGTGWGDGQSAWNRAWVAARGRPPVDLPLVAALGDVWLPPAIARLGRFAFVPTLDLTVHFRDPVPDGSPWVLAEHRSLHAADGTWTCDGTLWAASGAVLAQSRQVALLR